MDIDKPQSPNGSSHGKTVSGGSGDGSFVGGVGSFVVTPLNPNPTTQRGKEIVAAARSKSPMIAKSGNMVASPLVSSVGQHAGSLPASSDSMLLSSMSWASQRSQLPRTRPDSSLPEGLDGGLIL
jgi:hypothetical protein